MSELIAGRYLLVECLDKKSIASTWLATDSFDDNRKVVIKVFGSIKFAKKISINLFVGELAKYKSLNRIKHVLPTLFTGIDENNTCFIVTEFKEKGNLNEYLKSNTFDEEEAIQFIGQLSYLLSTMMELKVAHSNLKFSNLFYENTQGSEKHLQVTDVRISNKLIKHLKKYLNSEPKFSLKEFVKLDPYPKKRSSVNPFADDVFALAYLTVIASGGRIFRIKNNYIPYLPPVFSKEFRKVMKNCLENNVERRPTAAQLFSLSNTYKRYGKLDLSIIYQASVSEIIVRKPYSKFKKLLTNVSESFTTKPVEISNSENLTVVEPINFNQNTNSQTNSIGRKIRKGFFQFLDSIYYLNLIIRKFINGLSVKTNPNQLKRISYSVLLLLLVSGALYFTLTSNSKTKNTNSLIVAKPNTTVNKNLDSALYTTVLPQQEVLKVENEDVLIESKNDKPKTEENIKTINTTPKPVLVEKSAIEPVLVEESVVEPEPIIEPEPQKTNPVIAKQEVNKKQTYEVLGVYSEGLAFVGVTVSGKLKYGFMDDKGNIVIPFRYDNAFNFINGSAVVILNGERIFIDRSGNRITN